MGLKYSTTLNIVISAEGLGLKQFTHNRKLINLKTVSKIWENIELTCDALPGECYT